MRAPLLGYWEEAAAGAPFGSRSKAAAKPLITLVPAASSCDGDDCGERSVRARRLHRITRGRNPGPSRRHEQCGAD
jgi:hypothetical protein